MSLSTNTPKRGLELLGILKTGQIHWNLPPAILIEETLKRGQGKLADNGALCVNTGEFTGRSPKDKFIVRDDITADTIWWGDVNQPIAPEFYQGIFQKMKTFLADQELFARDVYAGADPNFRLKVRVVNTLPWANLFVHNMFIRPEKEVLADFVPDWTVLAVPGFKADPETDGTRQHNFTMVNFTDKLILIGGSGYTGEIKKGIFTVMNYLLPNQNVLSMHCSANQGKTGDTAVFFGLSGTGKTTLSADPNRYLIGDDEHAWTNMGVFNFEGGCYAKAIDLTEEKEPQIWNAIKNGALVENTVFKANARSIDFEDTSITQNTRVAYPIHHIQGALEESIGDIPKNVFFLTCDAFGVLPPISRLTPGQAMFQFISGYTAKVAGTEVGVKEPQTAFSSCFGEPFLPLHPTCYATLLGERIKETGANVWLINTGWTGGAYGVGSRIKLAYTRAMVSAALSGKLNYAQYVQDPVFGLSVPTEVPGVPKAVLFPRQTWEDPIQYDRKAYELVAEFQRNFQQYESFASPEMRAALPELV